MNSGAAVGARVPLLRWGEIFANPTFVSYSEVAECAG